MPFTELTLALKSAATALLTFWVFIIWSRFHQLKKTLCALAILATVTCYLFVYTTPQESALFWPVFILNLLTPLALLWGSHIFFASEDSSQYLNYVSVMMLALCLWTSHEGLPLTPWLASILLAANTLIALGAGVSLWRHYRDDLITVRRNLRVIISIMLVTYIFCVGIFGALASKDAAYRMTLRVLESAVLAIMLFVINSSLVRREFWEVVWGLQEDSKLSTNPEQDIRQKHVQTVRDKLAAQLMQLFEIEKVHLSQRLTLSDVAAKIGIPEHQLRQLINQHLGYENFNNFVNKYRVSHAADLLRDPARANDKVFALALESGFSSLAPFNKAFLSAHKMTPSDYRNQKP